MFSIQHPNMYLNTASNLIAIVLGCLASISQSPEISVTANVISTFQTPEIYEFLLRSAVGGIIAFAVKVGGDLTLNWLKKRKSKGGKDE